MAPAAPAASANPRGAPLMPNAGPSAVTAVPGAQPSRWKVAVSARPTFASSVGTGRKVIEGYRAREAT
eukprot:8214559-Alexandrium_andersonii.AAC.1